MTNPGPLLAADEQLTHQIVDTFARVGERDRGWTEKISAMAAAEDGSVQLSLGVGKYTNRGVMDAYAGISRGVEQWTVRASREFAPHPETAAVGPIRYEMVEPLREVRFALDATDALPISFEWTISSPVPRRSSPTKCTSAVTATASTPTSSGTTRPEPRRLGGHRRRADDVRHLDLDLDP